jgi:hypothetical protein
VLGFAGMTDLVRELERKAGEFKRYSPRAG